MTHDYYAILEIEPAAEFRTLRKAYRRRVMQCHPDILGGDRSREEEFKLLVEAFDVLSDPQKRSQYDLSRPGAFSAGLSARRGVPSVEEEGAILDSFADDILEELIVGNTIPRGSTLQTLMMDLEKTDRFCLFREAKTYFYAGRIADAERLFRRYQVLAPRNILAYVYLARCYESRSQWRKAEQALALAVRIGEQRDPKLQLRRIRADLARVRKNQRGLLMALRRMLSPPSEPVEDLTPEEQERRSLNRALNRLAARRPIKWDT